MQMGGRAFNTTDTEKRLLTGYMSSYSRPAEEFGQVQNSQPDDSDYFSMPRSTSRRVLAVDSNADVRVRPHDTVFIQLEPSFSARFTQLSLVLMNSHALIGTVLTLTPGPRFNRHRSVEIDQAGGDDETNDKVRSLFYASSDITAACYPSQQRTTIASIPGSNFHAQIRFRTTGCILFSNHQRLYKLSIYQRA